MFQPNTRYLTRGINERLPHALIQALWLAIDLQLISEAKLDYLQVFKFEKIGEDVLAIRHEQEVPKRKNVHYTGYQSEYAEVLNETVYVIDDGDHSTMLFAYEY